MTADFSFLFAFHFVWTILMPKFLSSSFVAEDRATLGFTLGGHQLALFASLAFSTNESDISALFVSWFARCPSLVG